MSPNEKFGPAAQTAEQRVRVVARMLESLAALRRKTPVDAHAYFARYISGELSWLEMREELRLHVGLGG
ncbi:MAG: hypothetical protein EOO62_01010 [Hymenobacter sp.]|nr:MAG: hypothetical protein EOO62_01010 [Hymenobacter sp.]